MDLPQLLDQPTQAKTLPDKNSSDYNDAELDQALESTFPASDPIPTLGQATPIVRTPDALEVDDEPTGV